jgi:two-component system response regulator MprA
MSSSPNIAIPVACPVPTRRRRILAVDDDQAIREVLRDLLTGEGYDVRMADDGAAALAILSLWRPDLIVLDLHMAGIDGWVFLKQQPMFADIPVLILTADHQACDQADQSAAPMLVKPFELDDLLATIERLITARR